jgi:UDPglucose 6-dehydrogenase
MRNKLSILGMGYVGLCTAACFADRGFKVVGVDRDEGRVEAINQGIPPLYEPGLEEILRGVTGKGCLRCTTDYQSAIAETEITFITVGTPSRQDGGIDLTYVEGAAKNIGAALREIERYHLVVVKSTVTPGTTNNIVKPLIEEESKKRCGEDFGLCMNPEFLREGHAIEDTLKPDRIVIGEEDERSGDTLASLYREFYGEAIPPLMRTSLANAEMIKYATNTFLAARISLINTFANICQLIPGTDIKAVAEGIGLDKRIGPHFLNAGLGYGGSCFPKDVRAITKHAERLGYPSPLLKSIDEINDKQPFKAIQIAQSLLGNLEGKRIAILGLSFKPGTDDIREAVSIKIIEKLLEMRVEVKAYDPKAVKNAQKIFGDKIEYAGSAIECIKEADCCIIVTEWEEFKKLKPKDFKTQMKTPTVIDGRRIYNPDSFKETLRYAAIGLGDESLKPRYTKAENR